MKNIFVSPNGINISEINNSKKMKQKYDVIFVGRLVYQKNPELLIKAINILRKNSPNIKVAIIGGGLEEEYLKKLVNNLGLERNIYFLGKIKNHIKIYPFLKSSLVFAHPSRAEGFSLVLLEAAACGLPIVTTNNKWNLSSVQFLKGNGIVSSENAEDFAKKINEILNNKILRNKMSKKSIKISKDFDWRNITDKLEEYYKRVLQK
jgi:glycosyltransferase involved in cell wall biosynthesis